MSDNPRIAENQQERLDVNWLVGFTDGEGCFSISFVKNNELRFGYQIFLEFVITQGERSLTALEKVRNCFGVGKIYINRRYDNHKENIYRYCVRNRKDLLSVICPFFQKHQLVTDKKSDFEIFYRVAQMMERNEHLTKQGFEQIKELASGTNRQKKRLESSTTARQNRP